MNLSLKRSFKLLALFFIPSAIIMSVYILLAKPIMLTGYPNIVAFSIAVLLTFFPVFIGIMLIVSKRELGHYSIKEMIKYKQPLKLSQYFWLVTVLLLWAAGIFTALRGLDEWIKSSFFSWFPSELAFSADYSMYDKPQLLVIFIAIILVLGLIGPIVEEIYFRGFLLPRMEWMGWGAPIVHALLFSLYHVWSPWQFITRFIAILPFCIVSYKTKNIKVVIIMHCLLNIFGDGAVVLFLLLK